MRELVADRHSRGNEPTVETQRVKIGDLFVMHEKKLIPDPGAQSSTEGGSS
jgi:hypothetical protein